MGKRRSGRRFFQKSWPIRFQGFPASTVPPTNQKDNAELAANYLWRIKSSPAVADCARRASKTCEGREAYCDSFAGFGCPCRKSNRRFALWNSGPRPERHGHKSLFTGGKLCRCQRFCSRVRCERSIHRKVFPGAVNSLSRNRRDSVGDRFSTPGPPRRIGEQTAFAELAVITAPGGRRSDRLLSHVALGCSLQEPPPRAAPCKYLRT